MDIAKLATSVKPLTSPVNSSSDVVRSAIHNSDYINNIRISFYEQAKKVQSMLSTVKSKNVVMDNESEGLTTLRWAGSKGISAVYFDDIKHQILYMQHYRGKVIVEKDITDLVTNNKEYILTETLK
jgi:hypothetical protein